MRCFSAWALWFIGRPVEALARAEAALVIARARAKPHGLAHALSFAAVLHQLRREPELSAEYARATVELSREHGLALYQAEASFLRAIAIAREQKALMPELRAGMGLVRLAREHGRAHTAAALVQPLLERFTEGLETADLVDARAMVEAE